MLGALDLHLVFPWYAENCVHNTTQKPCVYYDMSRLQVCETMGSQILENLWQMVKVDKHFWTSFRLAFQTRLRQSSFASSQVRLKLETLFESSRRPPNFND
jgi:hypothetical protein